MRIEIIRPYFIDVYQTRDRVKIRTRDGVNMIDLTFNDIDEASKFVSAAAKAVSEIKPTLTPIDTQPAKILTLDGKEVKE